MSRKNEQSIEPAIKNIEYRKRRGERMSYLMKREQPEEDEFWNNNKYFNDENMDDDELYEEKEIQKEDSFDSDFVDSSDSSSQESQKSKQSKEKSTKVDKPKTHRISGKASYIHDHFNQDYLIREAVQTELRNKISLQYLIQIEEDKKKIKIERDNKIEGPFIRWINSANGSQIHYINFEREQTPQLFNNPAKIIPKQRQKYKDPQTGQRFSNIQEYKQIKRNNKLQDKINTLQKLII